VRAGADRDPTCLPSTSWLRFGARGHESWGAAASRARLAMRRHGLREVARIAVLRVWMNVYVDERHVWLALRLSQPRPRLDLPPGYDLLRASSRDIPLLSQLGVDRPRAGRRLAEGHELWLMRHGADVVYSGWVFHGLAPTVAAPSGWVPLPRAVANPEDVVTSPLHRGRGLASAAYTKIFDDLARDGRATAVVGKIPVGNTANRRAVQKTGWREFAVVHFRRLGPWRRATVHPLPLDEGLLQARAPELTAWLAAALQARSTR